MLFDVRKEMSRSKKIILTFSALAALFLVWALGVGIGRINGDKAAAHNQTVHNMIILGYLEENEPDKASNWCKRYFVDGYRGRSQNPSPISGFSYFMRYRNLPDLSERFEEKAKDVINTYKPNDIDLSGSETRQDGSGFTVEIPIE